MDVNELRRKVIAGLNHSHLVGKAGGGVNVLARGLFLVRDVLVNGVDNVIGSGSSYWQRAVDTITVTKGDVKNPLRDDCSVAINKGGVGIWQRAMRYWNEFSRDVNVVDETRQRISQRTAKFLVTDSAVGEKVMGNADLPNVLATKLRNSLRDRIEVNPIAVATGGNNSYCNKLVVVEVKEEDNTAIHFNSTRIHYVKSKGCGQSQNKLQCDDVINKTATGAVGLELTKC